MKISYFLLLFFFTFSSSLILSMHFLDDTSCNAPTDTVTVKLADAVVFVTKEGELPPLALDYLPPAFTASTILHLTKENLTDTNQGIYKVSSTYPYEVVAMACELLKLQHSCSQVSILTVLSNYFSTSYVQKVFGSKMTSLEKMRTLEAVLLFLKVDKGFIARILKCCSQNEQVNAAIKEEATLYFKSAEGDLYPLPYQMLSSDFLERLSAINKHIVDDKVIIECPYMSSTLALACTLVVHESTYDLVGDRHAPLYPLEDVENYFQEHDTDLVRKIRELLQAIRFLGVSQECFVAIVKRCSKVTQCSDPRELFYPHELFYREIAEENLKSLPGPRIQEWISPVESFYLNKEHDISQEQQTQGQRSFGIRRELERQLMLSAHERRRMAFAMVLKHANQDPAATFPSLIDQKSWQDLELLCGPKAHPETFFAAAIDRTSTEIGKAFVYSRLLQPSTDAKELQRRQAVLKLLTDPHHEEVFSNLERLFKEFFHSLAPSAVPGFTTACYENNILSFFLGKDTFEDILSSQSGYSKDEIVRLQSFYRYLNSSELYLCLKNGINTVSLVIRDKTAKVQRSAQDLCMKGLGYVPFVKDHLDWVNKFASVSQKALEYVIPIIATEWARQARAPLVKRLGTIPESRITSLSFVSTAVQDPKATVLSSTFIKELVKKCVTSRYLLTLVQNEAHSLLYTLPLGFFQNMLTTMIINIMKGVVCNGSDFVKELLEVNFCLQERLVLLAKYITFMKAVSAEIQKLPALKEYMPSLDDLALGHSHRGIFAYFWNECTNPADFEQFLRKVCSATFEKSDEWSHIGRVVAAYRLIDLHKETLFPAVMALAEFDAYFSIARLYKENSGKTNSYCFPAYLLDTTPCIDLKGLWHPAVGSEAVSNTVSLGVGKNPKDIIITGPNTGGKSTLLRALVCAILMGQSFGIMPAGPGSKFTPVSSICAYLNIVDDPAKDISLFKASIMRVNRLLKPACDGKFSLTLFDELYNGTKPDMGESLAYGTLKVLNTSADCPDNLCIATTHFPCVTKLRQEYTGTELGTHFGYFRVGDLAENAQERFKLRPGIYTESNAFAVAKNSNLPAKILAYALWYHTQHFTDKHLLLADPSYLDLLEKDSRAFLSFINQIKLSDVWLLSYQELLLKIPYLNRFISIVEKHKAVLSEHTITLSYLLNLADSKKQRTVLHNAALTFVESEELLARLIASGANVDAKDGFGKTPLQYAQEGSKTYHLLVNYYKKS